MKNWLRFSGIAMAVATFGAGTTFVACGDSKSDTDGGGNTDSGGGTDGNMQADTGGGMDSGNGDGGGGTDAALQMNCGSYCKFALSTCTGANAQYLDEP